MGFCVFHYIKFSYFHQQRTDHSQHNGSDMSQNHITARMDMGGMSMPSGSDSSSSSTMDMSGHMMGMSDMMMVFFTSTGTPLYSKAWTPGSAGTYAGTCIFLIVLAFIFRGLLALRCRFTELWNRSTVNDFWRNTSDLELGAAGQKREPWRINKALTRAILDTILAGVSYLL